MKWIWKIELDKAVILQMLIVQPSDLEHEVVAVLWGCAFPFLY